MRTHTILGAGAFMILNACSAAPGTTPTTQGDAAPDAEVVVANDAGADVQTQQPTNDASSPNDASARGPTLFGAAFDPRDDARHDALSTQWGGMEVTRSYDDSTGVMPFLNTYQSEDIAWKAASSYSFKYLPLDVIAGDHDADIKSFFEGIADNHVTYWTYYHEPDDQIYKDHTFTAPDYRSAWAHIRSIADAVKATRPNMIAYATFICMSYSMTAPIAPSRPLTGPNGMYPGDSVIDVFGVDVYNEAANGGGVDDAATQFGVIIDFAQQHGKPWAIGEIGSCVVKGNSDGRSTYLKNAFAYWVSRSDTPLFAAYFDIDMSTTGGCDFTFDNDTATIATWKSAMTNGIQ